MAEKSETKKIQASEGTPELESKETQTPRGFVKIELMTPCKRMVQVRRHLSDVVYGIFSIRTRIDMICRSIDLERNLSKQDHAMLLLRTNGEFIKVMKNLRRSLNEIENRGVGLHYHTVALIDDFNSFLSDDESEEEEEKTKTKEEGQGKPTR